MTRTFRTTWLAAALTCTITPWAVAVEDLVTLLPEKTTFLVSASDLKAVEKLEDHAVVKVISTPELKKAFAPTLGKVTEQLEKFENYWKEEAGLDRKELQELFNGSIAMGMTVGEEAMIAARKEGKKVSDLERDDMQVAVLAHFSGDEAKAEKVINALMRTSPGGDPKPGEPPRLVFPDDYNSETDDDRGVKLHLITPKKERKNDSMAWALYEKVLITGNSEEGLRAILDRIRNGGPSLAAAANYKEVAARVKGSDVQFFMHVQPMIKMGLSTALEKTAGAPASPGTPDMGKVFSVLGFDQFESVYAMANTKENALDLEVGMTYQQKPGIMRLIATSGPGKVPDFLSAELPNGGYGTFDWSQFMTALQELMKEAMPPMSAMFDSQLDVIKSNTGVDIKKGLLGSFGINYWTVSGALEQKLGDKLKKDEDEIAMPEAEPQVMGIELKDRKAFDLALTSLLNYAAPGQALFEKLDYQGYTLNQIKGSPIPIIYLTTDDWFVFSVGPRTLLDKVLSRLSKGGSSEHLFTQPHVVSSIRALPEGGDGTTYTDLGSMLETIISLVRELPGAEFEEYVDVDALPAQLKLPLALSSRIYNEANSIRVRFHIEEKAK